MGRHVTAKSVDLRFDESLIEDEDLTTPRRVRRYRSPAPREITRRSSGYAEPS